MHDNDPTYPNLFGELGYLPTTKAKQRQWMDRLIARDERTVVEIQQLCTEFYTLDPQRTAMRLRSLLLERLTALAALRHIRAELHNRGPRTHGEVTSEPFTPEKRAEIVEVHVAYPTMPQHEIAIQTGVNQGRVNNALHGVRE